jgi:hypothetical protein
VYHHSQLIIATHSPIPLAYPHARIYEFGDQGIKEIGYQDTEHFQITKDFLNNHPRMLDLLLTAEDADLRAKERETIESRLSPSIGQTPPEPGSGSSPQALSPIVSAIIPSGKAQ